MINDELKSFADGSTTELTYEFSDEGYNSLDGESYLDYSEQQSVVNSTDDPNRSTVKDEIKDRSKVLD